MEKRIVSDKPIKSQKEADEVFKYLVSETVRVIKCSNEQAEKRITNLLDSGKLDGINPNSILFKIIIDTAMKTPV